MIIIQKINCCCQASRENEAEFRHTGEGLVLFPWQATGCWPIEATAGRVRPHAAQALQPFRVNSIVEGAPGFQMSTNAPGLSLIHARVAVPAETSACWGVALLPVVGDVTAVSCSYPNSLLQDRLERIFHIHPIHQPGNSGSSPGSITGAFPLGFR